MAFSAVVIHPSLHRFSVMVTSSRDILSPDMGSLHSFGSGAGNGGAQGAMGEHVTTKGDWCIRFQLLVVVFFFFFWLRGSETFTTYHNIDSITLLALPICVVLIYPTIELPSGIMALPRRLLGRFNDNIFISNHVFKNSSYQKAGWERIGVLEDCPT